MSKCQDDLEREFYIQMTKKYGWTKNVLIHQVEGKSYEKFLLNQTNFDKAAPFAGGGCYRIIHSLNTAKKIL